MVGGTPGYHLAKVLLTRMNSSMQWPYRGWAVSVHGNVGGGDCSGVYTPGPRGRHPLALNRITDRCKNITFPQLMLWTVKNCIKMKDVGPSR